MFEENAEARTDGPSKPRMTMSFTNFTNLAVTYKLFSTDYLELYLGISQDTSAEQIVKGLVENIASSAE